MKNSIIGHMQDLEANQYTSLYRRVKDQIKEAKSNEEFISVTLRSGEEISNITPYAVVEKQLGGSRNLFVYYLDDLKRAGKVNVNDLPGLNVIEEDGQLLVEFQYLSSKSQELETNDDKTPKLRRIKVNGIAFGVQGSAESGHLALGEKPDFYFTGEDVQYPQDRQRRFPWWRMGVYGPQEELVKEFMPSNEPL